MNQIKHNQHKIKFLVIFILHLSVISLNRLHAENTGIIHYSGGMLIFQPGFTTAQNQHQRIENLSWGIGGILRFYIKQHWVVGIIGGSYKTKYQTQHSQDSYLTLGYGGPFVGIGKRVDKVRFCLMAGISRGSIKNLHIEKQSGTTLTEAYFYRYKATVFYPMISVDYRLTERISATIQGTLLGARTTDYRYSNPAIQVGILFNR